MNHSHLAVLAGALVAQGAHANTNTGNDAHHQASALLQEFVEDYRSDQMARPLTFGIEIRDIEDGRWHVVVGVSADNSTQDVQLHDGFPDDPVIYFTTDIETITRVHEGSMASLTGMAKAFSSDFAPLDLAFSEGFVPSETTIPDIIACAFHFWTRGFPEKIPFGDLSMTRRTHGSNASIFYYQPGFRSGYFMIEPGDHANQDENSKTNPFPTLLIITKGEGMALIGGRETKLSEGEAIFIGPNITHEFWVDEEAEHGVEGVLLMFGDGA